jgi:hypothetical protein
MHLNIDYLKYTIYLWYITIAGLIVVFLLFRLYFLAVFFTLMLIISIVYCQIALNRTSRRDTPVQYNLDRYNNAI